MNVCMLIAGGSSRCLLPSPPPPSLFVSTSVQLPRSCNFYFANHKSQKNKKKPATQARAIRCDESLKLEISTLFPMALSYSSPASGNERERTLGTRLRNVRS